MAGERCQNINQSNGRQCEKYKLPLHPGDHSYNDPRNPFHDSNRDPVGGLGGEPSGEA
jgi:hypothetical protein